MVGYEAVSSEEALNAKQEARLLRWGGNKDGMRAFGLQQEGGVKAGFRLDEWDQSSGYSMKFQGIEEGKIQRPSW